MLCTHSAVGDSFRYLCSGRGQVQTWMVTGATDSCRGLGCQHALPCLHSLLPVMHVTVQTAGRFQGREQADAQPEGVVGQPVTEGRALSWPTSRRGDPGC